MALTEQQAVAAAKDLIPRWRAERDRLDRIHAWGTWNHDLPAKPTSRQSAEYKELIARAQAPWGDLIITSVAQTLYVEGYRRPSDPEDPVPWSIWQANGWDSRQIAVHRAALEYGYSYALVLPGRAPDGSTLPMMRGVSPREMFAAYADPAWDDWPMYALRVTGGGERWRVDLYDAESVWSWRDLRGLDDRFLGGVEARHDVGVCPVVRYRNREDLEGQLTGEIEPHIPLLGKIDQTSFDRLVVQRFAAWVVRYATGMDVKATADAAGISVQQAKMQLRVEDFLTGGEGVSFGSLPASSLDGFIKAHETDLTNLAAVSQTPAYELLGQLSNLSAEALAAARASLTAKSDERKKTFGEAHEQTIRLACALAGADEAAGDYAAEVRWADTSIRSLAQAVDAYGKLVQMLGVPAEVLWPKIPGFSQQDVDEAKARAAEGGALDQMLAELVNGQTSAPSARLDPAEVKARADAMGVLIRAGVSTESAAAQVGLAGLTFTGAVPSSLRLPEVEAAQLEQA